MALVGSSVSVFLQQLQQTRMERRGYRRTASEESSGSARNTVTEIEEEPAVAVAEEEEEKVYFAAGKEVKEGKANLLWVLESTSGKKKIVIVHVHRRAQRIPKMGAWIPVNQLEECQVEAHWQHEREKMNGSLDEYLDICARSKVQAEKLVIERDDVCKGLVELIAQHGITKLVMGAAADKHYSKKMKELRSKTALRVQQQADPSCKIWFICGGKLICMRDSAIDGSGIVQPPSASSSPMSGQSVQLSSKSLPQRQTRSWYWRRSRSVDFNLHGKATLTTLPLLQDDRKEGSPYLPLVDESKEVKEAENLYTDKEIEERLARETMEMDMFEESQNSCEQRKALELQISDSDCTVKDFEMKLSAVHCLLNSFQLEHEKLQKERDNAVREAKELRLEHEKLQREKDNVVIEVEDLQLEHEKLQRERDNTAREAEELRLEHEKLQRERDNAVREAEGLQLEYKKLWSERDNAVKEAEELRLELDKLRAKRENAVREAEELHQMKVEMANYTHGARNFSEFSYVELKQATHDFDDSLKIGEGGYGRVYKGFLHHTIVAIKKLNPQSMQGQSDFHQEVDVLSRVRHPNLVTLMGACPEARVLVYEFLPNGSLEDHLVCKDKITPLPWQIRIRIAVEICSALIFLHSNKPQSVVHGDLKPANILLDANFTSKLGDFGTCRFLVQSNTSTTPYCRTYPKGTIPYVDPEFITSGELTPHSDVYSFGIIILQLLTGMPALGIIGKVRESLKKGCLDEILDASAGGWPYERTKQLAHLGLKCCEAKRKKRPYLTEEVWRVLEPMMKAASSKGLSCLTFRSASEDKHCIPSYFICPLSKEIMKDPHIAADGITYEAEAIKGWLDSGHDTSPVTNLKLAHGEHLPNYALRSVIEQWLQQWNDFPSISGCIACHT